MELAHTRTGRRLKGVLTATTVIAAIALVGCVPPEEPPTNPTTTTSTTTSSTSTTTSTTTTSTTTTSTTSTTTTTIPAGSTTLAISGHLEYFGEAQVGPRQIRVRTYGTSGETIPGGFLITVNAAAPYGSFSTVIPVGDDVRSVNLITELPTPEGMAYFPSGSYPITTGKSNSGVYNTKGSFVNMIGRFFKDGQPYTQSGYFTADIQAYDANGSSYGLTLHNEYLEFDPWGEAELVKYVDYYKSVAGGNPATDPATLEFNFYGFDDPDDEATLVVDLDRGPAFYSGNVDIDITQDGTE